MIDPSETAKRLLKQCIERNKDKTPFDFFADIEATFAGEIRADRLRNQPNIDELEATVRNFSKDRVVVAREGLEALESILEDAQMFYFTPINPETSDGFKGTEFLEKAIETVKGWAKK